MRRYPVLPLRDIVVFPENTTPLLVGRPASVNSIKEVGEGGELFVVTQKEAAIENVSPDDLFDVGTVVRIVHISTISEDTYKVLVEGLSRGRVIEFEEEDGILWADVEVIESPEEYSEEVYSLSGMLKNAFEEYVKLHKKLPIEILLSFYSITDPDRVINFVVGHINVDIDRKQKLLSMEDIEERIKYAYKIVLGEIEMLKIAHKIEEEVRSQIEKNQKHFFLNEQLRAIRKELGYDEDEEDEVEELLKKIEKSRMPADVKSKAQKEAKKLAKMSSMSPEAAVVRNYLDWLISMPWNKRSKDNLNIKHAIEILDKEHYGLEKVKERIVEYLSVLKLTKGKKQGQILCFVGAPGVGKTSLGRSIAHALNRKLVRISLGGVRDEAEIRGHRRTYVGALPGKIIQMIRKAGTKNPVFILDEIDKIGMDFRGDPASALLEVLDPEQNHSFLDHYLEVEFDLSEVLFIATANVLYTIPEPLKDRMEIIHIPGYLEHDKIGIAKYFLVPRVLKSHGIKEDELQFTDSAIKKMIRSYTREAGVRSLEKNIASIARKIAKEKALKNKKINHKITPSAVEKYLGHPKYFEDDIEKEDLMGVATGLAWTPVGGQTLRVETLIIKGRGDIILTGQLGEVMQESAKAALSYIKYIASDVGISHSFFSNNSIHIHVPEGAIPKDGPSAGITLFISLLSSITGIPVKHNVAMTGEITLRGIVLPVGGLQEKIVAAKSAGIDTVIVPLKNFPEIEEMKNEIKKGLNIIPVSSVDEVIKIAMVKNPFKKKRRSKNSKKK